MDEFGMLAKDFGFRPQGKSAPMKSSAPDRRNRAASSSTAFKPDANDMFSDVFGGPPKYTNSNSKSTSSISDFDYDSIFKDSVSANANESKTKPKSSNSPVYDKPLYDDDIFDGLPGVKSKPGSSPASARYEDNIFASMTSSPPQQSHHSQHSDQFDDLLGNFGRTEKVEPIRVHSDKSSRGLDDLIPGFGSSSPASSSRWSSAPSPSSSGKTKEKSSTADDPFVVLESTSPNVASSQGHFTDPLEQLGKIGKSSSTKSGVTSPSDDVVETNSLNRFNKSPSAFSKETNNRKKDRSRTNSGEGSSVGSARSTVSREPMDEYSFGFGYSESQPQKASFDHFQESRPTVHVMSRNSPTSHTDASSRVGTSPKSEEHMQHTDEIWLTVSEIPLFTPVTRAPPPSRPPPPIPTTVDNDFFPSFSSAKYSQNANASRRKESVQVAKDDDITRERLEREREEEEREQRIRLEKEKREMEREKAKQAVERANREARERAAAEARLKAERAAVQRAQTEARERAAIEARERAVRVAAEKAAAEAKEKETREKEKAAAEAKEKEAREKEKTAVAKAQAEARRRAERAAVERVTAEARERAAAEARERAAAASKMNQPKSENDLDSFFSSRPNSVRKARTNSNDSATDPLSHNSRVPEGANQASSSGVPFPSNVRKASSATNFVDDLSSIFGAGMPAGEFQDVEGETEERRRARLERQQRTQERAAKALAEKNQRDLQVQMEQDERQRISASLDVEIKRWAAGKEGNLRAMLSTLQYVLWPESGWQPVSLTDLITAANVKKVYRKATLCIHPDKVQQKGANLQQKYVAEKVFDLLKEAWNKFNSEELF